MSLEGNVSRIHRPTFRGAHRPGCRICYAAREKNVGLSTIKLYYDPGRPSAFPTLTNLATAVGKKKA